MSVTKEEQISAIITDWISTMDYLTGPDLTPMLEAVSQNCIEGINLKSIREKVENTQYQSLNEFIYQKRKEVNKKIEKINKCKAEMKELFASLPPTLPSFLEQIPEAIESVRREMDMNVPHVKQYRRNVCL